MIPLIRLRDLISDLSDLSVIKLCDSNSKVPLYDLPPAYRLLLHQYHRQVIRILSILGVPENINDFGIEIDMQSEAAEDELAAVAGLAARTSKQLNESHTLHNYLINNLIFK